VLEKRPFSVFESQTLKQRRILQQCAYFLLLGWLSQLILSSPLFLKRRTLRSRGKTPLRGKRAALLPASLLAPAEQ
jgi:hypothetical protein